MLTNHSFEFCLFPHKDSDEISCSVLRIVIHEINRNRADIHVTWIIQGGQIGEGNMISRDGCIYQKALIVYILIIQNMISRERLYSNMLYSKLCITRIKYSLKYYHTIAWYESANDVKLLQKYFYSLQLKRTQWNSMLNMYEVRIYALINRYDSQELCLLVYVCYEIWMQKHFW